MRENNALKIKKYLVYKGRLKQYTPDRYFETPLGDLYLDNLKWCVREGYLAIIDGVIMRTHKTRDIYPLLTENIYSKFHDTYNNLITKHRGVKADFDYKNKVEPKDMEELITDYEINNPTKILADKDIPTNFKLMTDHFSAERKKILKDLQGVVQVKIIPKKTQKVLPKGQPKLEDKFVDPKVVEQVF